MACGRRTLRLNGLEALWIEGMAARESSPSVAFHRESDGRRVDIPCYSLCDMLGIAGRGPVELLHIDAQGAELALVESLGDPRIRNTVRFLMVSTHHEQISGSATTHADCLRAIRGLSGVILAEFSVEKSFSGDGLIVASLCDTDAQLELPPISRNHAAASLFQSVGPASEPARGVGSAVPASPH